MNSAFLLAGIGLFLFILKSLMIASKTNLAWNPFWQALSFLNSSFLYPWFCWGGYQLALFVEGQKLESIIDLQKEHEINFKEEKSKRYDLEKQLAKDKSELRDLEVSYRSQIRSLEKKLDKKQRSAKDADDDALRSLL